MTLVRPGTFFRIHSCTSVKEAWLFAMITYYVAFSAIFVYTTVFLVGLGGLMTTVGTAGGGAPPFPIGWVVLFYGCLALLAPPVVPAKPTCARAP